MMINKIPAKYMVICDVEIMFCGTKKECKQYYDGLPNPCSMILIKIENKWELTRKWQG
jgi:hypothetical protein